MEADIWIVILVLIGVAVAAAAISVYIVSQKRRRTSKLPLKKNGTNLQKFMSFLIKIINVTITA